MLSSECIEGGFVLFKLQGKLEKWKKSKALLLICHIQIIHLLLSFKLHSDDVIIKTWLSCIYFSRTFIIKSTLFI